MKNKNLCPDCGVKIEDIYWISTPRHGEDIDHPSVEGVRLCVPCFQARPVDPSRYCTLVSLHQYPEKNMNRLGCEVLENALNDTRSRAHRPQALSWFFDKDLSYVRDFWFRVAGMRPPDPIQVARLVSRWAPSHGGRTKGVIEKHPRKEREVKP